MLNLLFNFGEQIIRDTLSLWGKSQTDFINITLLEKLGRLNFHPMDGGSSKHVFVNKNLGLVIKKPYLSGSAWIAKGSIPRTPKRAIPTRVLNVDDEIFFIQPLADLSGDRSLRSNLWHKMWRKFDSRGLRVYEVYGTDLHPGNIGKYNGKWCVFDWGF